MTFHHKQTKEQCIEELLLSNYQQYYRLAYSYVHNDADAADIVQEGAYKAIKNAPTLKNTDYAATWVYRIMLNEIFRLLNHKPTLSFEDVPPDTSSSSDTYEDFDLKKALETLVPEDRMIIQLRFFENLPLSEIAKLLDENVNTVKSRLYRGLKKLRLTLEIE